MEYVMLPINASDDNKIRQQQQIHLPVHYEMDHERREDNHPSPTAIRYNDRRVRTQRVSTTRHVDSTILK